MKTINFLGILKEGDYLIQVGVYSLTDIDVPTALKLIERAYDEGRQVNFVYVLLITKIQFIQTISFVAARLEKPSGIESKSGQPTSTHKQEGTIRRESRARSFIEYENENEENYSEQKPVTSENDSGAIKTRF